MGLKEQKRLLIQILHTVDHRTYQSGLPPLTCRSRTGFSKRRFSDAAFQEMQVAF